MTILNNNLISKIWSYRVLDAAYEWLRAKRIESHPNNSFWSLSLNWPSDRASCRTDLQAGDYHFSPVSQIQLFNGESVTCLEPLDSNVNDGSRLS